MLVLFNRIFFCHRDQLSIFFKHLFDFSFSIGPPGLFGPVGMKGNIGPVGSPGIDGYSGRDGEKGDRGFEGKFERWNDEQSNVR